MCAALPRRALAVSGSSVVTSAAADQHLLATVRSNADVGNLQADLLVPAAPGTWVDAAGAVQECARLCSGAFEHAFLCGSARTAEDGLLVRGADGATRVLAELLQTQATADDYVIQPAGECRPCTTCANGEFNAGCGAQDGAYDFGPGTCTPCTTACAEADHYLAPPAALVDFLADSDVAASGRDACRWDDFAADPSAYAPQADVACEKCPTAVFDADAQAWSLVAGCGNRAEFTRWDPGVGTVASVTCSFAAGGAACARPGGGSFQAASDLYVRVGELLPYCPPGWFVDTAQDNCPLADAQDSVEPFAPACCVRCTDCDFANQERRHADYAACPGGGAADTQVCADACGIGEYMVDLPAPAGSAQDILTCARCTACYDGEHAVAPLGAPVG